MFIEFLIFIVFQFFNNLSIIQKLPVASRKFKWLDKQKFANCAQSNNAKQLSVC